MDLSKRRIDPALIRTAAGICLLFYAVITIYDIGALQWDFTSYYYAAKAALAGANPYDAETVSAFAQKAIAPYGYHPFTLPPFMLLSLPPFAVATRIFLALKIISLVLLLLIWKKIFLKNEAGLGFFVLCLLGYNTAFFIDLRCGNIALFEQLLLWVAFWAYLHNRLAAFCLLVLLAALFKLQPLFFLCLIVFCDDRKKIPYGIATLAAFILLNGAAWLMRPDLFAGYLRSASQGLQEGGIMNPSTLNLAREVTRLVCAHPTPSSMWLGGLSGYVLIVIVVVSLSLRAIPKIQALKSAERRRWLVFLLCFVYALVCPRFKNYSFILLLAPTYAVIRHSASLKAMPWLILLVVMPTIDVHLPFYDLLAYLAANYYPLLVATGVWIMCLRVCDRLAPKKMRLNESGSLSLKG